MLFFSGKDKLGWAKSGMATLIHKKLNSIELYHDAGGNNKFREVQATYYERICPRYDKNKKSNRNFLRKTGSSIKLSQW